MILTTAANATIQPLVDKDTGHVFSTYGCTSRAVVTNGIRQKCPVFDSNSQSYACLNEFADVKKSDSCQVDFDQSKHLRKALLGQLVGYGFTARISAMMNTTNNHAKCDKADPGRLEYVMENELQVRQFPNSRGPRIDERGKRQGAINQYGLKFADRCNAVYVVLATRDRRLRDSGEFLAMRSAFQVMSCYDNKTGSVSIKGKASSSENTPAWCNGGISNVYVDDLWRQVLSEIRFAAGKLAMQHGPMWQSVVYQRYLKSMDAWNKQQELKHPTSSLSKDLQKIIADKKAWAVYANPYALVLSEEELKPVRRACSAGGNYESADGSTVEDPTSTCKYMGLCSTPICIPNTRTNTVTNCNRRRRRGK